jgi:hypothetical protein
MLRGLLSFLSFLLVPVLAQAQSVLFEGSVYYNVRLQSKLPGYADDYWKSILAISGNTMRVDTKDGNWKQVQPYSDIYFIGKEAKIFYRFRKLDTLYYSNYSDDTVKVLGVTKSDEPVFIHDLQCKTLFIKRRNGNLRYLYSPNWKTNNVYDVGNSNGSMDVYTNETGGALWLYLESNVKNFILIDSCIRIEPKTIDSKLFELPKLPQKKLDVASLVTPARFPGKPNAWMDFLNKNLDPEIASKYLKIKKGEKDAVQQVMVKFKVGIDGNLSDIEVLNKKDLPKKLAEEAIRVISISPRWIPGTIYGEKAITENTQPVIFKVVE